MYLKVWNDGGKWIQTKNWSAVLKIAIAISQPRKKILAAFLLIRMTRNHTTVYVSPWTWNSPSTARHANLRQTADPTPLLPAVWNACSIEAYPSRYRDSYSTSRDFAFVNGERSAQFVDYRPVGGRCRDRRQFQRSATRSASGESVQTSTKLRSTSARPGTLLRMTGNLPEPARVYARSRENVCVMTGFGTWHEPTAPSMIAAPPNKDLDLELLRVARAKLAAAARFE